LAHYRWPGNVRQLKDVIRRASNIREDVIEFSHLGLPTEQPEDEAPSGSLYNLPFHDAKRLAIEQFERHYFECLMEEHGGNRSSASRSAGLDRHDLRRFLQKHGLGGGSIPSTEAPGGFSPQGGGKLPHHDKFV
jgi:DNA-binding NtrC family response regulator